MRTSDHQQHKMFFYVSADNRVPKNHPLRAVKAMASAKEYYERMLGQIYSWTSGYPEVHDRCLKLIRVSFKKFRDLLYLRTFPLGIWLPDMLTIY